MEDKHSIAKVVRKYLKGCHPGGLILEVIEKGIRKEEHSWNVPVRPSMEPVKLFEYYEALADVEIALEDKENLTVFLSPTSPPE